MEKSFNNRTSVIYQNPRHPQNYKMVKKRWILVPMCEYKVSVPYPKSNELNLFQMTILKLLVSGSKEDDHIGSLLCLNQELVAFIVDELERYKLIDNRRRVTNEGLQLVRNGASSYEIKTGYVYYNYATKTFMDAFVPDDKRTEIETGNRRDGAISFDLGTVANRNWHKGTILNVDTSATITPNPYEVISICKRHNRRTRNLGFMEEESDEVNSMAEAEERKNGENLDLPWEIQSVKMLGTQKDIYVATYMFMAVDDIINRSKLQVCYPFGEGTSSSLIENIDKLSHKSENETIRSEILGLKNDVFGMSNAELEMVRKGHSESEKKMKQILSDNIDNYPAVRDALLTIESSYLLVSELIDTNKGSNREIIKKNLDDYIVYNYNLLASILIYTAKQSEYFTDAELTNHVEQNSVVLCEFARKIGFADKDGKTFSKFFRIKTRAIQSAVKASQHQLNALFAYNLVIAEHFPEHPFYKLAKAIPNLIDYLSALRELRNDSSHANDIYQDFELIAGYRKKNMYVAYLLLDGLEFNNVDINDEDEKLDSKSKENLVKAMREAELSCESLYVDYFQRNTNIANQLRNLQFEILIGGNKYPKRSSEVFEAIFKQTLSTRLVPEAVKLVKDSSKAEMREDLLQEIRGLGFNLNEIPFNYKERVLATFRNYSKGSLLTLFYAWYYSEMSREDGMLVAFAKKCPEFVKLMQEIHTNRGHSGEMDFNDKRLEYTKRNIDKAINIFLELLFEHGSL